jgi:hypothetical protein
MEKAQKSSNSVCYRVFRVTNQNLNIYSHSHQVLEAIFGTPGSGTPFDTANNMEILRYKKLLSGIELIFSTQQML